MGCCWGWLCFKDSWQAEGKVLRGMSGIGVASVKAAQVVGSNMQCMVFGTAWGFWVCFEGSWFIKASILPVVPSARAVSGKAARVVGQNMTPSAWRVVWGLWCALMGVKGQGTCLTLGPWCQHSI